jgi:hypothetical protein
MADLLWRKLKDVTVPAQPKTATASGTAWTAALDFVAAKRLYRLQVQAAGKWKLKDQTADCTADGYTRDVVRAATPLLIPESPLGALIAKIGGGTADNTGLIFAAHCIWEPTTSPCS